MYFSFAKTLVKIKLIKKKIKKFSSLQKKSWKIISMKLRNILKTICRKIFWNLNKHTVVLYRLIITNFNHSIWCLRTKQ